MTDQIETSLDPVLERWHVTQSPARRWQLSVQDQTLGIGKTIARRCLQRLRLRSAKRAQTDILREYDSQWRKKSWDKYRPSRLQQGAGSAWLWGQRRFLLSNEAGAALRLIYLYDALSSLKPSSVLEVGCGNGVNLHLLAASMPDVSFTGIEPTAGGFDIASTTANGDLPDALRDFSPIEIKDDSRKPAFVKGSAAELPFPDRHFDVVMTSLALEQMEEIRDVAIREIVRVAKIHVVLLEPFRDVNTSLLRRAYIKTYDYFQGAIGELSAYGLQPTKVVTEMPHKAWLGTAVVIARKI